MPNAMQVINAGLYADRVVECILKWQATAEDDKERRHACKDVLRKAGFSVLGSGYYGFVIDGPAESEFVVKVCIDSNDGYPMYAKWAKANPQPGVMPVWLAERITDTCFVAVLPRLLPVDGCDERQTEAQRAIRAARYNESKKTPGFEYLHDVVRTVLDTLGDFANEDMHYGNWMQCPVTGMVYLTDPFAGLYIERERAESTAERGEFKPYLKDQFDLFDPTYPQLAAISSAKIAVGGAKTPAVVPALARSGSALPKKSFPMPKPWVDLARPCLARGGLDDGCNCARCRPVDVQVVKPRLAGGNNLNFRVPPDLKPGIHNAMIQGLHADMMRFDIAHLERNNIKKCWFVDGIECGERTKQAWQIAKPLLPKERKVDEQLLERLRKAAEAWGLNGLFANLPVKRVRYHNGFKNPALMNPEELAQPITIKERLELDFDDLERRVLAHAGGHKPDRRFDVRLFTRWSARHLNIGRNLGNHGLLPRNGV